MSYYVSNFGSDSNSGTTQKTPWATLNKVNSTSFLPCTTIYFERGGVWRGQLFPQSGSAEEGPIDCTAGVVTIRDLSSNGKCFYDDRKGYFYMYWNGTWPSSIKATVKTSLVILVDQRKFYPIGQFTQYQLDMSLDQNSKTLNPEFVDIVNHNFHLTLASPSSLKVGGAFLGVLDDFDQWTRNLSGNRPSIGAFEFH